MWPVSLLAGCSAAHYSYSCKSLVVLGSSTPILSYLIMEWKDSIAKQGHGKVKGHCMLHSQHHLECEQHAARDAKLSRQSCFLFFVLQFFRDMALLKHPTMAALSLLVRAVGLAVSSAWVRILT